ncbi:MAG TPA: hypothetical protein VFG83_12505 [Kofleriaceae bacterium]|nr:hypothetical protein [Kofleriaceae bacterium]
MASADDCPPKVAEVCARAIGFVTAATGVTLEFDSDTLPVLDHYVRAARSAAPEAQALVQMVAGVYFGEVVRRRLGGTWQADDPDPGGWRVVLPGGLVVAPMAAAEAAITRDQPATAVLSGPPTILAAAEEVLERMAAVSDEVYFSLSGRFDTLEHVHETLVATAAARAENQDDG